MDLGRHADDRARRRGVDGADDRIGRAGDVAELHHLVCALGVDHDDPVRILGPERLDVLRPEALVHRAVPPPQEELGGFDVDVVEPSELLSRIPEEHVVGAVAELAVAVIHHIHGLNLLLTFGGPVESVAAMAAPGHDPSQRTTIGAILTFTSGAIGIVYGGAIVGLMGAVADAALAAGGKVIGVMPQALVEREIAHKGLSEIHVTQGMHERKALMEQLSDGFIALPGGPGTLEEIAEQWTWGLLGIHAKPCGILNVAGFFEPLLAFLDGAVAAGFVRPAHRETVIVDDDPARLLDRLAAWTPVAVPKWLDRAER